MWTDDTVSRIRTVSQVAVRDVEAKGGDCEVRQVYKSLDESMIAVVVYEERKAAVEIVLVRVSSKECLITLNCNESGMQANHRGDSKGRVAVKGTFDTWLLCMCIYI